MLGPKKRMIEPTRLKFRDAVEEALGAILARPARAGLTVLGVILGVASFVAVLGITSTVSGQISEHFTALLATEVTVVDAPEDPENADFPFPGDTERRINSLNGVRSSGIYWRPDLGTGQMVYPRSPLLGVDEGESIPVISATPGYFAAIHAELFKGRLYDSFHQDHKARVCVLGRAAAAQLGITSVESEPSIFIGTTPLLVIGIVGRVARQPEALSSIIIPSNTARQVWGTPMSTEEQAPKLLIETELGAAQLIGSQAAVDARPDQPERFNVRVPSDPKQLKDEVNVDLNSLFVVLAGICLVIGAVGIANTTLVSVIERTSEIGLRRSLGARRLHVIFQFLTESAALGLLGGLIGTSLGVAVLIVTSMVQDWTPILHPATVLPAPIIGAVTGILAGLYPSWRAGKIEPIEALRR